jgi:hypothetical protein
MRKFLLALRPVCILLLLTLAAILIHGYHLGIEDQDVYLAAVNKSLNPALYPVNSIFFTEQMKSSFFIRGVVGSIRLTGLPVPWALFLWHVGSIFLVLLGCWKIASACFESEMARWSGVLLVTALLTLPIAGTALFLVDTYLHPRALAAGAILLALASCLEKRWITTAIWLVAAGLMHPLMALFGASLIVFAGAEPVAAWQQFAKPATAYMLLPLGLLEHPSAAWMEATLSRRYYFPLRWTWYEWLGLIAPVLLVWVFGRIARRQGMAKLELLATRLFAFALFQFVVGALMTIPAATEQLSSLQPMRWLHIFYFLFLLMTGGLIGQFLLKAKTLRWLILFLPLAGMMFFVQRAEFSNSDHLEWPGRTQKNLWAKAFLWSSVNTPKDAVFAIDPDYMGLESEAGYGMRALAERSLLAEDQKDPGAATVFPSLAPEWLEQVQAQRGIESFGLSRFQELKSRYDVSWVVLPVTAEVPLECPYRNAAAQVCRVD